MILASHVEEMIKMNVLPSDWLLSVLTQHYYSVRRFKFYVSQYLSWYFKLWLPRAFCLSNIHIFMLKDINSKGVISPTKRHCTHQAVPFLYIFIRLHLVIGVLGQWAAILSQQHSGLVLSTKTCASHILCCRDHLRFLNSIFNSKLDSYDWP